MNHRIVEEQHRIVEEQQKIALTALLFLSEPFSRRDANQAMYDLKLEVGFRSWLRGQYVASCTYRMYKVTRLGEALVLL